MTIESSMGDLSQFMYFFAAVYLGTPLIGGYGEAAFVGLQRRRDNCREAISLPDASQPLGVLDNALEDFRLALDAPTVKPSLSVLLSLALIHAGFGMLFGSVSSVSLPTWPTMALMLLVSLVYGWVALRGVQQVLNAERAAVRAARKLEHSLHG